MDYPFVMSDAFKAFVMFPSRFEKDMYDNFASDLEKATFNEGVANRDYENFMHTKALCMSFLEVLTEHWPLKPHGNKHCFAP